MSFIVPSASLSRILRGANSSSPDCPSRRSSSASTSAGAQAVVRQRDHACGTTDRPLRRRSAARSPSLAAITISVASSPIFFRIASGPLREQPRDVARAGIGARARLDHRRQPRQRVVALAVRSSSVCRSLRILQDRLDRVPGAVLVALEEAGVAAGVAGDRRFVAPLPVCSTFSSTTSLSQSRRISCTFWTWPDSSPLRHRRARERLQ